MKKYIFISETYILKRWGKSRHSKKYAPCQSINHSTTNQMCIGFCKNILIKRDQCYVYKCLHSNNKKNV